jgi:hypothetical protein
MKTYFILDTGVWMQLQSLPLKSAIAKDALYYLKFQNQQRLFEFLNMLGGDRQIIKITLIINFKKKAH